MSTKAHEEAARHTIARIGILVVSSTRTTRTDETGPRLTSACAEAGHEVLERRIVDDRIGDIDAGLNALIDEGVDVVLVTGGTGISARDVTPEAIRARFTRSLPGFGEIFRAQSFARVGPSAMLSRAEAGICGNVVVFLLPGSRHACETALELILPVLPHLVHQVRKPELVGSSGWRAVLDDHRGTLDRAAAVVLPGLLQSLAGVAPTLLRAGDRCVVRFEGEDSGVLLGYPDLVREDARVLLLRGGRPFGEVVALHRQAAALIPREGGWFGSSVDLDLVSQRWTGAADDGPGQLFAVDTHRVLVLHDGGIYAWNGQFRSDVGEPEAVVGQLIRDWSAG